MFIRPVKDSISTGKLAGLDALRTNVMIADNDLNITYMNPSVHDLLREAEADLKKELPRFSVATLIGSNIDVFHKQPSHQRGMLRVMEKPHATTIRVGGRVFDLLVTPLTDKGAKIGFVVEWSDARHRLESHDYAAQIAAFSRSQTIVEFDTDGTILNANPNFLRVMGYTLDEIRGRHHSMFVEPGSEKTEAYAEMWNALRRGDFKNGQFKRFGKGGKVVWIEGAYNPILDENGKVCKVVKFASNISAQMELVRDLKTLVDEMTAAVGQSTSQAQQATEAIGQTTQSVQSVTASTDQLANSIVEIAETMTRSRIETQSAFDQAQQVGTSTEALARGAREMNGIVGLIRTIASQINLLALNATIEAARAGDAGKGFAVVASEVKTLAIAAAKATEQITTEIAALQDTSASVARAVGEICKSMTKVRENASTTAAAVEEQSAVTKGMASDMQTASHSVLSVAEHFRHQSGNPTRVGCRDPDSGGRESPRALRHPSVRLADRTKTCRRCSKLLYRILDCAFWPRSTRGGCNEHRRATHAGCV